VSNTMPPAYSYADLVPKEDAIDALLRDRAPFNVTLSPKQARAAREAMLWDAANPRDWPLHRYIIGFARSYLAQPQFFMLYKKAQRCRMVVIFEDSRTCTAAIVPD
jgi:hypothetical protein